MVAFQDVAIGLLQLTHPETYLSISTQNAKAAGTPASAPADPVIEPNDSMTRRSVVAGRAAGVVRAIKFAFAALAAGSRTAPLGDNGQLVRDLAARAAYLYGNDRGSDTRRS
jgi:hypothetical protein